MEKRCFFVGECDHKHKRKEGRTNLAVLAWIRDIVNVLFKVGKSIDRW